MWPAKDFLQELEREIIRIKNTEHYSEKSTAFTHWALQYVNNLTSDQARSSCLIAGSGDGGIDAAYVDDKNKRLLIFQAKCSNPVTNIKPFDFKPARELFSGFQKLEDPTGIQKPMLKDLAMKYMQHKKKGYGLQLIVLISGNSIKSLDDEVKRINNFFRKNNYQNHHMNVIQMIDLNIAFEEHLDGKRINRIIIELPPYQPSQGHHYISGNKEAMVMDLPIYHLFEWVRDYEYSIIAENFRYPIEGSRYNNGILGTLDDITEMRKFWYYNNGITIVCDKFEIHPGDPPRLEMINPQIVNGCQTAFTIYDYINNLIIQKKKIPSRLYNVKVLARIIGTSLHKSFKLNTEKIARYTNSQNAIEERDLRSNDKVQKLLQRRFYHLSYFYQRKKKEWHAIRGKTGGRSKGGFRNGMVDNIKLAHSYLSFWLEKPYQAKNEKKFLFVEGKNGFYQDIFNPDTPSSRNAYDFLLPHYFKIFLNYWKNEKKNVIIPKRRKQLTKAEQRKIDVVTHGDLYFLSLIGKCIIMKYGTNGSTGEDKSLELIQEELYKRLEDSYYKKKKKQSDSFQIRINATYNKIFDEMDLFIRKKLKEDPNKSIRSIFISRRTVEDKEYMKLFSNKKLKQIAKKFPEI